MRWSFAITEMTGRHRFRFDLHGLSSNMADDGYYLKIVTMPCVRKIEVELWPVTLLASLIVAPGLPIRDQIR